MEKKLFVTDFDGTLLRDDKTISREDIRTLHALRQNKIYTAVATGRSVYSFKRALAALGMGGGLTSFPVDYVIFSTGAGIMNISGDTLVYQKAIPSREIKTITDYFDHRRFDYMVHKAIPDTQVFFFKSHGNHNPDFQARLALYRDYAFPLLNHTHFVDPATEVLAILPGRTDMEIMEEVKKALAGFSVIHATSPLDLQSTWIEVFHKTVSKSKTIALLAEKLGVGRKNVISVGNDYNDQDLLVWSGKGFVVDNAPEILKQVFPIVGSNNHSGMTGAVKASGLL